jgi:hypothetical protein
MIRGADGLRREPKVDYTTMGGSAATQRGA